MTLRNLIGWKGLTLAAATFGLIAMTAAPQPAHAVSPGEAVAIGLGSFALGSAIAGPRPYYPGYYGGYPYSGYYYPPAPAYYSPYGPRQCWDPYYGRYYAC